MWRFAESSSAAAWDVVTCRHLTVLHKGQTIKPVKDGEEECVQKKEQVIREKVCVFLYYTLGSLPDTAGQCVRASLWL